MRTAAALAEAWLDAFNRHDVEQLLALYADDCTHTSPKIRALYPDTGGKLVGKSALRVWWTEAIKRLPTLRYERFALTAQEDRVVLEYVRHVEGEVPMPVSESFDVRSGLIVASRVHHG